MYTILNQSVRGLRFSTLLLTIWLVGQPTCCPNSVYGQEELEPKQLATLELPSDISALKFSNDGTILAVSTNEKEIRLWNISGDSAQPRPSLFLPEILNDRCRLAFSLNGEFLAAADRNRIWVWTMQDGQLANNWRIGDASTRITELAYSGDSVTVVDSFGRVLRLDPSTKELESGGAFFGSKVRAISSDGRYCVRISDGLRLFAWDLKDGLLLPVSIPLCEQDEISISNDGRTIALAGVDWDGRKRDQGQSTDESRDDSVNAQKPVWGRIDGGIWTLNTETGEKRQLKAADGKHVHRILYSPDDAYLAASFADSIDFIYRGEDEPSSARRLTIPWPDVISGKSIELALAPNWPPQVAIQAAGRKVVLLAWPGRSPPPVSSAFHEGILRSAVRAFELSESVAPDPPAVTVEASEDETLPDNQPSTSEDSKKTNAVYTVFYGTNRKPRSSRLPYWLDEARSFIRTDVGLLLAGVCAVALIISFLNYLILQALTFVRALRIVLLIGFIYGGCVAAHTALVLRHDPSRPNEFFGNERGDLSYGTVQVSIPRKHTLGVVEEPYLFLTADPKKHIVLQQVDATEGRLFLERLATEANGQDAFIFIHGYNVSFEGAARRTAQMAHDLKFKGIPMFFSWPSKASMIGYVQDANNSDLAGIQLAQFLSDVEKYSGAKRIHLIAHSMGARVLANALREFGPRRLDGCCFREIILAAPDIDSDYFRFGIAPAIALQSEKTSGRRVTVYASNADKALLMSQSVNGFPRAGDASNLVVYPGIDTVDVSDLGDMSDPTGHSYYGGLPDLIELLQNSKPAAERPMLQLQSDRELPYWKHRRRD